MGEEVGGCHDDVKHLLLKSDANVAVFPENVKPFFFRVCLLPSWKAEKWRKKKKKERKERKKCRTSHKREKFNSLK